MRETGVPGLGLEHRGLTWLPSGESITTGKEEGGMIAYVQKQQGLGCVKPNHYFQVVMHFQAKSSVYAQQCTHLRAVAREMASRRILSE